jgi:hypothetical protein
MAPLQQELSRLEVEPLQIVGQASGGEKFDTVRSQESSLETLTALDDVEVASLLNGRGVSITNATDGTCCCCCCPACCCC